MCAANAHTVQESTAVIHLAGFLDDLIPLRNASHADVIGYSVEIPMRYAECFASLRDGRIVGFRHKRRFVGWTGYRKCRSLLFSSDGLHVMLDIDKESIVGPIGDVLIQSIDGLSRQDESHEGGLLRKFVGIDGSQVILHIG